MFCFSGDVCGALFKARMITEIQELKRTLNGKDSVQQILFRNRNDQGRDQNINDSCDMSSICQIVSEPFLLCIRKYFVSLGKHQFKKR